MANAMGRSNIERFYARANERRRSRRTVDCEGPRENPRTKATPPGPSPRPNAKDLNNEDEAGDGKSEMGQERAAIECGSATPQPVKVPRLDSCASTSADEKHGHVMLANLTLTPRGKATRSTRYRAGVSSTNYRRVIPERG